MKSFLDVLALCAFGWCLAQLLEVLWIEHRDRHFIQAGAYGMPGRIPRLWWLTRRVRVWATLCVLSFVVMVSMWAT